MKRIILAMSIVAIVAGLATAAPAKPAKQVTYVGVHPLPGATFCHIEGSHVHLQAPEHADVLYRVHEGRYFFVGDPAPFGYEGPKHAYYGHHPIVGNDFPDSFCYLDGPHYHVTTPDAPTFVLRGGAYWYTGDWPKIYKVEAPRFTKINVVYEPLLYARPVVTVAPPPEYRPPVIEVVVKAPKTIVVTKPVVRVRAPVIVIDAGYDYDVHYYRHRHHRKKHHHHHRHHDDDDD